MNGYNLKPSCLVFVYRGHREEGFFNQLHIGFEWRYFSLYLIECNQHMGNGYNGSKHKYYVI